MKKYPVPFFCLMLTLQACTNCDATAKNFLVHLSVDVGRNINQVKPYDFATNAHFIDSQLGKDGLLGYFYSFNTPQGKCIYVYKTDPETKIIKGWIIEKDGGRCFVVP